MATSSTLTFGAGLTARGPSRRRRGWRARRRPDRPPGTPRCRRRGCRRRRRPRRRAVSTLMPPSISISTARPRASISLRATAHLVEHLGDERLTAPAGVDAHHQQEVDLVEVRQHRCRPAVGGLSTRPTPTFRGAQLVEQRTGIAELDVHDAAVGTGVGEVLEQHAGVVDHEVAVEEQVGALAQRPHHRRADGEVGHEVTVHHVDVQEVGDLAHPLDLGPELGEVGGQDRRRQLHRGHASPTRGRGARGRTCRRCRRPAGAGAHHDRVGRPGRARAARAGSKSAKVLGGPLVDVDGLLVGERAHRVHEDTARTHQRRGGGASSSHCSVASSAIALGSEPPAGVGAAAQHADAAARCVEQHPVEASPARSGERVRVGDQRAPGAGARCDAGAVDHADPAGVDVERDHRHRRGRPARRWRWPCRRGRRRGRRCGRRARGAERGDHRLARPGPAAWRARRAPRADVAGSPRPRTSSASGTSRPRSTLGARGAELLGERVDGEPGAGRAEGDRRRLVHRDQRGARGVGAEVAVSRSTSQSGYESATASSSGSGHGRARRVSARRLAFTKPRARGERAADRVDGRRHRGVRRRVVEQLVRTRGATRRAPAGRDGGAAASRRAPSRSSSAALRAHGAVDEIGGERAVAVRQVGSARASRAGSRARRRRLRCGRARRARRRAR